VKLLTMKDGEFLQDIAKVIPDGEDDPERSVTSEGESEEPNAAAEDDTGSAESAVDPVE